jgi:hypothetical protein
MAITQRVSCFVISSVSFHEYGLIPLATNGPARIPTTTATTRGRKIGYKMQRSGRAGQERKGNVQASEMNSFSLTNMETNPKITINPESTAMASVNGEISPGKTVIPVIANERRVGQERKIK